MVNIGSEYKIFVNTPFVMVFSLVSIKFIYVSSNLSKYSEINMVTLYLLQHLY